MFYFEENLGNYVHAEILSLVLVNDAAFTNQHGAPVCICPVRMVSKVIARCVASPCDAYACVCGKTDSEKMGLRPADIVVNRLICL